MINSELLTLLKLVSSCADDLNVQVDVIGGVVRDELLKADTGDNNHPAGEAIDMDLVVSADLDQLLAIVETKAEIIFTKNPGFLTARYSGTGSGKTSSYNLDLVQARREEYSRPGALPIVFPGSEMQDLERRDFTINTLKIPLKDHIRYLTIESNRQQFLIAKVIDRLQGCQDLKLRQIRILHDKSFVDDPTRMFRACRYATLIGGKLEDHTSQCFEQAIDSNMQAAISFDRRFQEVKKTFNSSLSAGFFNFTAAKKLFSSAFNIADNQIGQIFEFLKDFNSSKSNTELFEAFKILAFITTYDCNQKFISALQLDKKLIRQLSADRDRLTQGLLPDHAITATFFHFLKN